MLSLNWLLGGLIQMQNVLRSLLFALVVFGFAGNGITGDSGPSIPPGGPDVSTAGPAAGPTGPDVAGHVGGGTPDIFTLPGDPALEMPPLGGITK
jgi:hypothetical protein